MSYRDGGGTLVLSDDFSRENADADADANLQDEQKQAEAEKSEDSFLKEGDIRNIFSL